MPANNSNTNIVITILIPFAKIHFEDKFVTLQCPIAKELPSSLISMYKWYDLNAANFLCLSQ